MGRQPLRREMLPNKVKEELNFFFFFFAVFYFSGTKAFLKSFITVRN